jgi:uncharacterized membrane protein YqjE
MAELERRATAAAPARQTEYTQADIDSLPSLFGRLGDDVMRLLDAKLGLLKVELKEEASVYGRTSAMMAVGGMVAAIGFALLNVALAFAVTRLFFMEFTPPISYALGFLVTGVLYLVVGGALILVMKNRLASHSAAPERTIEEIRKDKQWLKNEL